MKTKRYRPIGALASAAVLFSAGPIWAQVTAGFDFEVDAALDDGTNAIWESSPSTVATDLEFALDATVTWGSIASTSTQLTHAYDFPGGSTGTGTEAGDGGGKLSRISEGPGECYSFQDGPTPAGWDVQDVTMEIWFRPDNLTPPDGGYTLWEDGGGTGFGLFLTNNELITSQDTDAAIIAYNLSTDPSSRLIAAATTEFIQCVVTRTAAGATEMFINGVSVGTASDNDGDWSGGDGFGLGARGEANTGGRGNGDGTGIDGTTRSFDGQIALFRVYNNQILTPAEVLANFDALSGPDTTAPALLSLLPADDESDAALGDLVATFNEAVQIGTGEIRIVNDSDVVTTTITLPDPTQVTVTGATNNSITISPAVGLIGGKDYHVEIDATAIDDTSGNSFAGILDNTTWNFSTDGVPPTLDSFANNKPGGQVYDNDSVTYTVTFSEAMNASTVEVADFGNGGTATVTVDSVTPVSDSVFEIVVSPTSTGTLQLQVNAAANLEDVAGNALDTTTAIVDATVIDVLAFVANSASMVLDFQETVASEEFVDFADPADNPWGDSTPGRFWHISVNPNNVGYAAYIALDTSNNPIPPYIRSFPNPVAGWSFIGGGTNGDLTISEQSGGIVGWTTTDQTDPISNTFDSFGMDQKKFWNATDPGPDFNLPADETAEGLTTEDKKVIGYRSFGQATATIDVSALSSGKLIIFYGAFSATPQVDAILRDSSGLEPDIVLTDLHTNGDVAQRTEYYAAEVSFDTDGGKYDTIVHNYLQPGTEPDGSGNGRSGGLLVLGPEPSVGPVASFDISPIATPQTVGVPITGITITAKDASDQVATGFTGTVDFGGTGGFSGTSANFVDGVLGGVSVTPTVAGSDLTLTVTDTATQTFTGFAIITSVQSPYQLWANGGGDFGQDDNGDGVSNGVAFLLGASGPDANALGLLPTATNSAGDLVLSFSMLNAANRGGATLAVQDSNDLGATDAWVSALVPEGPGTDILVGVVSFDVTANGNLNDVVATIPAGEAAGGRLFGRLEATE